MLRHTHDEVKRKMLSDPATKEAYDSLNDEFELFREILRIRLASEK